MTQNRNSGEILCSSRRNINAVLLSIIEHEITSKQEEKSFVKCLSMNINSVRTQITHLKDGYL